MAEATPPDTDQLPVLLVASEREVERLQSSTDWATVAREVMRYTVGGIYLTLWDWVKGDRPVPSKIPWPHLPPEAAARRFQFDMGHPQDGTAYIQNPAAPEHYLVPALANERFVQEKVAAFVEIAEAMGAKDLTLKSGSIKSKEGNAGATLETAAVQAGLGVSFGKNHSVDRQVLMQFAEPIEGPHMPEQLRGWLLQDPILRSFVTTRLRQQRLLKAAVSLQLSESVELAAELTTTLPKMGIKTGGQYRAVQESTWAFEVEFWPGRKSHSKTEAVLDPPC